MHLDNMNFVIISKIVVFHIACLWLGSTLAAASTAKSPRGWSAADESERPLAPAPAHCPAAFPAIAAQGGRAPVFLLGLPQATLLAVAFFSGVLIGFLLRRRVFKAEVKPTAQASSQHTPPVAVAVGTQTVMSTDPKDELSPARASDNNEKLDEVDDVLHRQREGGPQGASTAVAEEPLRVAQSISGPEEESTATPLIGDVAMSPQRRPASVLAFPSPTRSDTGSELDEAGQIVSAVMARLNQELPVHATVQERVQLAQLFLQALQTQRAQRHSESMIE